MQYSCRMNRVILFAILLVSFASICNAFTYNIVDTGQETCYNNNSAISAPSAGSSFYGQDAQHTSNAPSYTVSGDGLTVLDNITGLTWQQSPDLDGDGDVDVDDKLTWAEVQDYPATLNAISYGGYDDWRVPTIKELYSLIKFNGTDPSGASSDYESLIPFIDSDIFHFDYGDTLGGERIIDSQYASNTVCVDPSWAGEEILFGVNFADGRIKGYDVVMPGGSEKTFTLLCVRGNEDYGINDFVDNGDGTITDNATGLIWQQAHSSSGMNWEDALAYAEDLSLGDIENWRLPTAKEIQSIVDYDRSPSTTGSAAIDPIFECNSIINEAGRIDYPWFWSGTTHANMVGGRSAAYLTFGHALGWMRLMGNSYYSLISVHGAGAQRSDPKTGSPTDYELAPGAVDSLGNTVYGHGPQGDAVRMSNYVRCVYEPVSTVIEEILSPDMLALSAYPNPFNSAVNISASNCDRIEIYNIFGKRINIFNVTDDMTNNYTWTPDSNIASGVYLIKVQSEQMTQVRSIFYLK